LPFRLIYLLQVSVVSNAFDSRLERQNLVIARHDRHGSKFKTLGQMHRGDVHAASANLNSLIEYTRRETGRVYCRRGSRDLL
jgi:hypothetical protein